MSLPILTLLFVGLAGASSSTSPVPEKTLWLVQPLYPGQELLVGRVEQEIRQLIAEDARASEVIGRAELASALKGKSVDLKCLLGDSPCNNPVDAAVSNLGFKQVVLVKGGQDEAGYKFQVASYEPSSGETRTAAGTEQNMERALFGALVKVTAVSSTFEVTSTPAAAMLFIDNQKIGTTPRSTQVLPGEHAFKLDLPGYKPLEWSEVVPIRGQRSIARELEKLPARVILAARPAGAEIFVDGKLAGKDKVDQGIEPGTHTIRITAADHHPFQTNAEIKPNDTFTLDKSLQPTTMFGIKKAMEAAQEDIYQRKSSFQVSFEYLTPTGDGFDAKILKSGSEIRTATLTAPSSSAAHVSTISAEYSTFGRYFGLMVIGVAYGQPSDNWRFDLKNTVGADPPSASTIDSSVNILALRALQPQLRVAIWHFTVSLQAGLETRAIRIKDKDEELPGHYKDAFLLVDLQGTIQGALRLFAYEGLFLEGAYRYSGTLVSLYEGKGPGIQGFRAGVGYAF